jgi:hypothetical protein
LKLPADLTLNYNEGLEGPEPSQTNIDEILDDSSITEDEIESKRLGELEQLLLAVLKDYWLHKYVLHCRIVLSKKEKPSETPQRVTSDLALLHDVKNIDKALAVLQSTLLPGSQIRVMKAHMNWRAMFPEHTVSI